MKFLFFLIGMIETTIAAVHLIPCEEVTPEIVIFLAVAVVVLALCGGLALMGVWAGFIDRIKKKEHDRMERLNGCG